MQARNQLCRAAQLLFHSAKLYLCLLKDGVSVHQIIAGDPLAKLLVSLQLWFEAACDVQERVQFVGPLQRPAVFEKVRLQILLQALLKQKCGQLQIAAAQDVVYPLPVPARYPNPVLGVGGILWSAQISKPCLTIPSKN